MSEKTVHHPVFARMYDRMSAVAEEKGAADYRRELLAGIAGRVIEIGQETGTTSATTQRR